MGRSGLPTNVRAWALVVGVSVALFVSSCSQPETPTTTSVTTPPVPHEEANDARVVQLLEELTEAKREYGRVFLRFLRLYGADVTDPAEWGRYVARAFGVLDDVERAFKTWKPVAVRAAETNAVEVSPAVVMGYIRQFDNWLDNMHAQEGLVETCGLDAALFGSDAELKSAVLCLLAAPEVEDGVRLANQLNLYQTQHPELTEVLPDVGSRL